MHITVDVDRCETISGMNVFFRFVFDIKPKKTQNNWGFRSRKKRKYPPDSSDVMKGNRPEEGLGGGGEEVKDGFHNKGFDENINEETIRLLTGFDVLCKIIYLKK